MGRDNVRSEKRDGNWTRPSSGLEGYEALTIDTLSSRWMVSGLDGIYSPKRVPELFCEHREVVLDKPVPILESQVLGYLVAR